MVRDVLIRFEGLATRLETQFVRSDNFLLYKQLVDTAISNLQQRVNDLASLEQFGNLRQDVDNLSTDKAAKTDVTSLERRVTELEDDKKWLIRLILGFIILAVLGAVFVVSKAGG
jgi:hypothetical protein